MRVVRMMCRCVCVCDTHVCEWHSCLDLSRMASCHVRVPLKAGGLRALCGHLDRFAPELTHLKGAVPNFTRLASIIAARKSYISEETECALRNFDEVCCAAMRNVHVDRSD